MSNQALSVVILAAGKGTRMHSVVPKALHHIAGKSMVQHVIDTSGKLGAAHIHLVYGYGGELIKETLNPVNNVTLNWVLQAEQHGTGHAMQQVMPYLSDSEDVLVLYSDVPLISPSTLKRLLANRPEGGISLLTVSIDNADGYGRIVRKKGAIASIVEHKDAVNEQLLIREINTGIMVVNGGDLKRWLRHITNDNAQRELYLTDIISMAYNEGRQVIGIHPERLSETCGVNDRLQLTRLERIYQYEQAEYLLQDGLMIVDPARFDLRGNLLYGHDVIIDINVILEGEVTLGNRVSIGTGCFIKNTIIGDNVIISPYTLIEDSYIASSSTVGPFAHLRSGSKLSEEVHVGNFVEMKKTELGKGTKAGHFSYLGDAKIGANVNIGAGTITCNYDGANKLQTIIGNDVFIGSGSQLVAPVIIGNGATIGAGTTVTNDISKNQLVLSRVRQFPVANWQRPIKKKQ